MARARSTDEELQYKAALTVGHLASNAVKLLPTGVASEVAHSKPQKGGSSQTPKKKAKIVGELAKKDAKETTTSYLDKQTNKTL